MGRLLILGLVAGLVPAAVQAQDRPNDRKPKPGSPVASCDRRVGLCKSQ